MSEKDEETSVTLELTCLEMNSGVEKVEISSVVDKVNTPASGSQQVFPFKLKKTPSFILPSVRERLVESDLGDVENCKDAMLLVEAMNLSTEENMLSSLKRMAASPQIQCASHMGTLQTTDKVPTASRTLSTEAFEAVGSPPMTELAKTQLAVQKLIARPQVTDSTPTNIIIPKRPVVTPSNIGILPKPSSTAATQTSVQSQKTFPRPVITLDESTKPAAALTVSSSQLISSSQEMAVSVDSLTAEVATISSQMSEEKNTVQEILSSETCTTLGESFISGYVQPSTPKILDSDFVSQTISMTKLSAGEPASNLEEEIFSNTMQYCALSNDQPTEEKGSVAPIQLTPALSTDTSDLHLQMSKTQFLAQLAVSPVAQAPQQASSNDFGASSAEISTNGKKKLQKNSLLTRLRRHLKTQLQTSAGCVDGPNVKNTASETIPISPKKSGVVEDVTSLNKTANDSIPKSPRRTGLCREALRSKMSVCEPTRRCLLKNQCGECGRILSSSAALESHVSLHNGRRPFSCTLCAKSFPDAKGLERHGRVHRNGRIYICKECGKGFTYRFGLTKHLQMSQIR
ncbi:putative GPI-anchored adhesin-like protein PGA55 [Scophthalmus maximus]|uniref:Putative GPI-anchored adhesin-like protein PGA55 n=1 Tax=Scophthalmus maximus TaxID=52904 RepID=A0A2U9BQD8_SCOMX|nr:putative GPI-anchored adhesin-like protein PGA55 [Scophthalmus maximus]